MLIVPLFLRTANGSYIIVDEHPRRSDNIHQLFGFERNSRVLKRLFDLAQMASLGLKRATARFRPSS
jgi:hypothetical protein